MILITVKFPIRADKMEEWSQLSQDYAVAVNAEPGCEFFEFSRSLADPQVFLCIEGFRDAEAGSEHMRQEHVTQFMEAMPDIVSAQPDIIYVDSPDIAGFGPMGEIQPRD